MPVIINEVEMFESQPVAAGPVAHEQRNEEPAHEQLRKLMRDLQERHRRLVAN